MFEAKCMDCGEKAIINTLASGSLGNNRVPSISWCKCVDRESNPDKRIRGRVDYRVPATFSGHLTPNVELRGERNE